LKNAEENCKMTWKIWKKSKLNSEKIGKIWKKIMLNGEMIWKIRKKSTDNAGTFKRKQEVKQSGNILK
jgi:hypothetical protein